MAVEMSGRRDGSVEDSIWVAMDFFELLKRERKAEVVDELDGSGFKVSNRVWWRAERRSSINWCFFCRDSHDHTFEIVSELGVLVQQSAWRSRRRSPQRGGRLDRCDLGGGGGCGREV
ncbi:hypothetical protein EZV62_018013 [Acer yangbiense]|uniref:Uncharacterized protein n=1 Tax=Acer yangbiense TaxID=1000413 RepID=A0A5C7HI28_9ROSI|nr:hypothetical protein EZV62_018013 [Acer yangbiense]